MVFVKYSSLTKKALPIRKIKKALLSMGITSVINQTSLVKSLVSLTIEIIKFKTPKRNKLVSSKLQSIE